MRLDVASTPCFLRGGKHMNGYYRSRSWGTVFVRVIDLLRKDNMPPQRFFLLILITGTALMFAVVVPVAAVPPCEWT
jgi:hypothetical protein